MRMFFTSDTHFGHAKIIEYCNRPFNTVQEMDAVIIARWNERVSPGDVVYHLGDFCFGPASPYARQLNGIIHLVDGSHDTEVDDPRIYHVGSLLTIVLHLYSSTRLALCHYAMRSWPLSHYGSWHLFGHHHGKLAPYGLSFDVGVDTNDFYPYSLDEVAKKMATLQPIVDYRKKS